MGPGGKGRPFGLPLLNFFKRLNSNMHPKNDAASVW